MRRLALRVSRSGSELVLAQLLELSPQGFEEVDVDAQTVEYALYGDADALPSAAQLTLAAGDAFVSLGEAEIEDDWAERWREFHKPLVLGTRLAVRPPWEPAQGTELDLVIDPGRAFGTGAHATTRLCLEMLLELGPGEWSRLCTSWGQNWLHLRSPSEIAKTVDETAKTVDLGCGSGVLAIAAAKLGLGPVLALDYDPLAVAATAQNAAANGVSEGIEVRRFDLTQEAVPAAPLVLANLLAPLLLAWAAALRAGEEASNAGPCPALIIASGVLSSEADTVCAAFAKAGYEEDRRLAHGEWSAIALRGENCL